MSLTETVQTCEKDGDIMGRVANYPDWCGFELQVHPDYRGGDLHLCMVDWVEAQVTAHIENNPNPKLDAEKVISWDLLRGMKRLHA